MPRGKKSKMRARERHHHAQEQQVELVGAQTSVAVEEFHFSPLPILSVFLKTCVLLGCYYSQDLQQALCTDGISGYVSYVDAHYYGREPMFIFRNPLDEKVLLIIHYMLYKYKMKELITKSEMRNMIPASKNHFSEILKRASEHMELIFGLDLKELEPNKHIYALISKLDFSSDNDDERNLPKTGLLMIILGVIFIRGNCATEEQIWEILNMIGLQKGRLHFIYGEPHELITQTFVQENYLIYRQILGSDSSHYEFLWGPRAFEETSKMKVLEYLAKICNIVPRAFAICYEEALKDEEERAKARAEAKAHRAAIAFERSKVCSTHSTSK
ncbi:melanoma-associated antigen B10-like [Suncus etruscus]|uniref:melanoma-associated antigen B10-like n=1 Tax=Suncus etruscus TaxID=109475 RepID=UPI00210FAA39|nr:melanoma-associated antigen B10-like [Suncus etruscus]